LLYPAELWTHAAQANNGILGKKSQVSPAADGIGTGGFEPPVSSSQSWRLSR
jgi:hypothetical protein